MGVGGRSVAGAHGLPQRLRQHRLRAASRPAAQLHRPRQRQERGVQLWRDSEWPRQHGVTCSNLQLKRIKRTEKKGTESVMEEKFSVYFWTEFQIGELKFQVWTLSLPVVVIVHGNQEPQALATITWDNAFAEWGRPPFRVPDKVPWAKMAEALNMKWQSQCSTVRSLTQENLYYLATKIFRNPNLHVDDFKNLVISWGQF